ncbi:DsbC family protein [Calidifontimicrobium sp. SYSU G02091]|uniref:DsbC family protein n=1 Tax=Calidifontimicrobium sp. SYSU G02091 TaxID=2926421 RepID=UPI001F53C04E|nr:DsbC family protein [Calidifontimicrobium sp. SYSU G02091]MCI1190555.1 DsbC family protein [Calidifontimicrobium sp. SYSU G02091]
MKPSLPRLGAVLLLAAIAATASAQEAVIRKNLAERLPQLPKIDEVTKTPVPGLWEVRIGNDVLYTDERGDFVVQGAIFDTRTRTNLTEERINKLTAIDFATLPLKDAMVVKQGSGARKLVVFADPNCGFCKRFERDLLNVKDVTIYTFLYPILGADSTEKSRAIWCAKDPMKAWRDWMIDGVAPPKVSGKCDDAVLQRNLALGQKHRIQGTPAIVYEDGTRSPGALPAAEVEKQLAARSKS